MYQTIIVTRCLTQLSSLFLPLLTWLSTSHYMLQYTPSVHRVRSYIYISKRREPQLLSGSFTVGLWNCQFADSISAFTIQAFHILAFAESLQEEYTNLSCHLLAPSFFSPTHLVQPSQEQEQVCRSLRLLLNKILLQILLNVRLICHLPVLLGNVIGELDFTGIAYKRIQSSHGSGTFTYTMI